MGFCRDEPMTRFKMSLAALIVKRPQGKNVCIFDLPK
jgi:hypothetical protein